MAVGRALSERLRECEDMGCFRRSVKYGEIA